MAFEITEHLQQVINHLKTDPTIVDVAVYETPEGTRVPSDLPNPLKFVFSVLSTSTGQVVDATLFVPDTVYNNPNILNVPVAPFSSQLYFLITYDNSGDHCDLCNDQCRGDLNAYIDPVTMEFKPMLGFEHVPVELTTVDPELQLLVSKIKQIPDVTDVILYVINDDHVKLRIPSEADVYRCFCYYGDSRSVDGQDNISVALVREAYMDESHHDYEVLNITNLIQQNKEKNNQ